MVRPHAHEEIQELLGAYALDAVDPDEAEVVELHLRECPRCRDEVAGHREAAALLGYVGAAAPEGLWQRIAVELEGEAPPMSGAGFSMPGMVVSAGPPPGVSGATAAGGADAAAGDAAGGTGAGDAAPGDAAAGERAGDASSDGPTVLRPHLGGTGRRRSRRSDGRSSGSGPGRRPGPGAGTPSVGSPSGAAARARRAWMPSSLVSLGSLVAAAAVVVALAVQVGRLERRLDDLLPAVRETSVESAALAALADPSARRVPLRSTDGASAAEAVLLPSGEAFLVASSLPELPPDQTYQLWAIVGDRKISVGVLGRLPRVAAFRYAAEPALIALTAEPAGGVETTTKTPVVYGAVPPRST